MAHGRDAIGIGVNPKRGAVRELRQRGASALGAEHEQGRGKGVGQHGTWRQHGDLQHLSRKVRSRRRIAHIDSARIEQVAVDAALLHKAPLADARSGKGTFAECDFANREGAVQRAGDPDFPAAGERFTGGRHAARSGVDQRPHARGTQDLDYAIDRIALGHGAEVDFQPWPREVNRAPGRVELHVAPANLLSRHRQFPGLGDPRLRSVEAPGLRQPAHGDIERTAGPCADVERGGEQLKDLGIGDHRSLCRVAVQSREFARGTEPAEGEIEAVDLIEHGIEATLRLRLTGGVEIDDELRAHRAVRARTRLVRHGKARSAGAPCVHAALAHPAPACPIRQHKVPCSRFQIVYIVPGPRLRPGRRRLRRSLHRGPPTAPIR